MAGTQDDPRPVPFGSVSASASPSWAAKRGTIDDTTLERRALVHSLALLAIEHVIFSLANERRSMDDEMKRRKEKKASLKMECQKRKEKIRRPPRFGLVNLCSCATSC